MWRKIRKSGMMKLLPPRYWKREGGESFGNTFILYILRRGECSCLLYLQMVRR